MSRPDRRQPAQTNAADPRQVAQGSRIARAREARFLNSLRAVMETEPGRIVMLELIRRCKVFESIWHASAEIHYNAGRQDFGHELMATLVDQNLDAYQLMEREGWEWLKREQATIAAGHEARRSADTGGQDER